jgi:hypothetical protein
MLSPLILYALFAMLLGLSVHKRWWGGAVFALAMLIWMIVIQLCYAITLHPVLN